MKRKRHNYALDEKITILKRKTPFGRQDTDIHDQYNLKSTVFYRDPVKYLFPGRRLNVPVVSYLPASRFFLHLPHILASDLKL